MGEPFFSQGSEKAAEAHYMKQTLYENIFRTGPKAMSVQEAAKKWAELNKELTEFKSTLFGSGKGGGTQSDNAEHEEGDGG